MEKRLTSLEKPLTDDVRERVREQLRLRVPRWLHMKVEDKAEYLGMLLGLDAWDQDAFAKPISNMIERTQEFTRSGAAVSLATRLFQQRGGPCAGYVAQSCEPP